MAKVQTAIRIDQELLDAFDRLAEETGESRTDVMIAALRRGLIAEQKILALEKAPVVREALQIIDQSGLSAVLLKLLGQELDPRRTKIEAHLRNKRRGRAGDGKQRGTVS